MTPVGTLKEVGNPLIPSCSRCVELCGCLVISIAEILHSSALKRERRLNWKQNSLRDFCKVYISIEDHISLLFLLFIFVWLIFIKTDRNLKYYFGLQFVKNFSCRNDLVANNIVKQKFEAGYWPWYYMALYFQLEPTLFPPLNRVPNVIERTRSHMFMIEKKPNKCNNWNLEILLTSYGKIKSLLWFILCLAHWSRCIRNAWVNETLCLLLLFKPTIVISDFFIWIWIFLPITSSQAVL